MDNELIEALNTRPASPLMRRAATQGTADNERIAEMSDALQALALAEANYRKKHDLLGSGHIETGRAWDIVRRAGDAARAILEGKAS